jgi:hypothetical protein
MEYTVAHFSTCPHARRVASERVLERITSILPTEGPRVALLGSYFRLDNNRKWPYTEPIT